MPAVHRVEMVVPVGRNRFARGHGVLDDPRRNIYGTGVLNKSGEVDETILSIRNNGGIKQLNVQAQRSVRHGRAAVDFYKTAFGAVEVFRFGGTDELEEVVAQLAVGNSFFWVEDESPPYGNFSPESVDGATVRMLLIVDDPESAVERAVATGASKVNAVTEEHGWLLRRIDDPFGHRWEIGKPISDWPPPGDLHSSR